MARALAAERLILDATHYVRLAKRLTATDTENTMSGTQELTGTLRASRELGDAEYAATTGSCLGVLNAGPEPIAGRSAVTLTDGFRTFGADIAIGSAIVPSTKQPNANRAPENELRRKDSAAEAAV